MSTPADHSRLLRWLSVPLAGTLLLCASLAGAGQGPVYHGLDHVLFDVADLERTRAFYQRLFGDALWQDRQKTALYLPVGKGYLGFAKAPTAAVSQIGYGINGFDPAPVQRYLSAQNLRWELQADGQALRVADRDGTQALLVDDKRWEAVTGSQGSVSQPAREPALFHALGIDEVYIMVSNLEVDSLHYARLLGQTGKPQAGSLWFDLGGSQLRLSQAPVGQPPGVHAVSVLISHTDLESAAEQVFAAGGIIEDILPNGFSFWDPDGLRVEVHVAMQVLKTP